MSFLIIKALKLRTKTTETLSETLSNMRHEAQESLPSLEPLIYYFIPHPYIVPLRKTPPSYITSLLCSNVEVRLE
jgi:hypothetical protein